MKTILAALILPWWLILSSPCWGERGGIVLVAMAASPDAQPPNHYQILKDYLAATLGTRVEIIVVPTIEEVVAAFQKGGGDLFIGDLQQAVAVAAATRGSMVLEWTTTQSKAPKQVLLAKEGGGAALDGYKGGVVGLRDDSSIGHFYLTRAVLAHAGIFLERGSTLPARGGTPENRMRYEVLGSDGLILAGLRAGRLDLGVVESSSIPKTNKLREVARLPSLPRFLVVFSSVIDASLTSKIKNTMVYMDMDPLVNRATGVAGDFSLYRIWDKQTGDILQALADSFVLKR